MIDMYSYRAVSWVRYNILHGTIRFTDAIIWFIGLIVDVTDNLIPNIDNLPDISKILDILNFDLPNFKDLLPTNLFDLNIADLLKDLICGDGEEDEWYKL